MIKTKISLLGCDDSTIFEMELTEEEVKTLQKVAEKSDETSTYGCMPIMQIETLS